MSLYFLFLVVNIKLLHSKYWFSISRYFLSFKENEFHKVDELLHLADLKPSYRRRYLFFKVHWYYSC